MLNQHLVVKTYPKAAPNNIVVWKNYRITVLGDQLFRIEHNSEKAFRDEATQTVWYRNMPEQSYAIEENNSFLLVKTKSCELKILEKRADCRIRLNGGDWKRISNDGNLKGTYRTLDCCDGNSHQKTSSIFDYTERPYPIKLGTGVCSASGIAVFDDANSLTLAENGEVLSKRGSGSDEYVFAFGNDYREAIKALYKITGNTPIVPRFALGNWWSRYYVYTQEEYLRLLNRFEERKIPLSVATIDMDWHYSTKMEEDLHIEALGRNTPFYGGNNGWTGYSWNKRLFPDYKALLKEIKEKGLKITLNLHPAGGVRWWEDQYEDMALALGKDPTTLEKIPFDVSSPEFINAYFSVLHKPFEEDGVGFWWIDWQQGTQSSVEGLDPLWALNHYHYLDNALNHTAPLILSRYAGVGSHRYPLGFSGDTFITWKTLEYLPYFTLTASNVGYTWWSHDIGGHMFGEKNDELYVRHVQFGVMSPINRLHSSSAVTMTKEPWYYKNGAGEIAQQWLRFRHQLIPYLYSASRKTNQEGIALVEPLYYEWDCPQAYRYKNEYIFGGELLVVPITKKANKDGYARVKAWIPEGTWIDIFTGDRYVAKEGGVEKVLLRTLDSIPVLIREGGILPLCKDEGNCVDNPKKMDVRVWSGNGSFELYEDGRERDSLEECKTVFVNEKTVKNGKTVQTLRVSSKGDSSVVPADRTIRVLFEDITPDATPVVQKNRKVLPIKKAIADCAAIEFAFEAGAEYCISVEYEDCTEWQKLLDHVLEILRSSEAEHENNKNLWNKLKDTKTAEEFASAVERSNASGAIKLRLKETVSE